MAQSATIHKFPGAASWVYFHKVRLLGILFLFSISMKGFAQPSYLRTFVIGEDLLVLEIASDNTGKLTGTLSLAEDQSKKTKPFFVYTESFGNFKEILKSQYKNLFDAAKQQTNLAVIENMANILYREIILYQFTDNSQIPPSGELLLTNNPWVDSINDLRIPCKKKKQKILAEKLLRNNEVLVKTLETKYLELEDHKTEGVIDLKALREEDRSYFSQIQKYFNDEAYFAILCARINTLVSAINEKSDLKNPADSLLTSMETLSKFRNSANHFIAELTKPGRTDTIPKSDSIEYYLNELLRYFSFGNTFANAGRKELKALIKSLGDKNFCYSERIQTIDLLLMNLKEKENIEAELQNIRNLLTDDKSKTGIKQFIDSTGKFCKNYNENLRDFSDKRIREATVDLSKRVLQQEKLLSADKYFADSSIVFGSLKIMNDTLIGVRYHLESLESNNKNEIETLTNDSVERASEYQSKISMLKPEEDPTKLNNEYNAFITSHNKKSETLRNSRSRIKQLIKSSGSLVKESNELLAVIQKYSERRQKAIETDLKLKEIIAKIGNIVERPLLDIKSFQFEFGDGMMKNILVEGTYKLKPVIFLSKKPVPFSSLTHFENLHKVVLYDVPDGYKTSLDRIIRYKPIFNVGAEDYSPSDSAYHIEMKGESSKAVIMMKEKTSQILEAKAFTDLMGFGVDQPNGIIQFEISKKIPIWTQRISLTPYKYRSFVSFFSYYRPQFNLSKIEMKDKFYYPQDLDYENNKPTISTLDLYRYANMSLKAINFNVVNIEIVEVKTSFEFNGGFTFLTTPVKDTLFSGGKEQQWLAVSGMPFAEFAVRIKPDTRYGVSLSANFGWLFLWDDRLQQINDPGQPQSAEAYNRDLWTLQFDAFYKPFRQSEGALFFRLANIHTFPFSMNYLQVQLGYAFNLLKKAGVK